MALDFLAGCVGGCAGVVVGYPLDTVKVRIQTQDAKNPVYRGTFHCLRTIVQQESARGLFKGMSSPMASVAVINAMIFGVYGNVQRRLNDPDSLRSHALAGSVAGLVQSFVCSPMELVKTRIQLQEQICPNGVQLYKGPVDCVRQIWQSEGIRGISRGLSLTIAREIPAFGLYFSSYEAMTRQSDPTKPIGTAHMMVAGGCAGICSWLFTYPIDFLKSRFQVDGLAGFRSYSGIRDCLVKTYESEGVRGFFRGMPSTLIRSFPVNAVTFSVVTWILRWADPLQHREADTLVTYQDAATLLSMQDSLTFARDHHINSWTAEWKHLGVRLALTGPTTTSTPFYSACRWAGDDALTFHHHHNQQQQHNRSTAETVLNAADGQPGSVAASNDPSGVAKDHDHPLSGKCQSCQASENSVTCQQNTPNHPPPPVATHF